MSSLYDFETPARFWSAALESAVAGSDWSRATGYDVLLNGKELRGFIGLASDNGAVPFCGLELFKGLTARCAEPAVIIKTPAARRKR